MLKQFVARGLLLKQSQKQAAALLSVQQRAFAPKKKKKVNADGVEAGSVTEEEPVERERQYRWIQQCEGGILRETRRSHRSITEGAACSCDHTCR